MVDNEGHSQVLRDQRCGEDMRNFRLVCEHRMAFTMCPSERCRRAEQPSLAHVFYLQGDLFILGENLTGETSLLCSPSAVFLALLLGALKTCSEFQGAPTLQILGLDTMKKVVGLRV